jgi:hypothetical protein
MYTTSKEKEKKKSPDAKRLFTEPEDTPEPTRVFIRGL